MVTEEDITKIRKKYPSRLTRGRSIKLYCKESCSAGDTKSWRDCTFDACFLWNFRLGREIILGNRASFKKQRKTKGFTAINNESQEVSTNE